MRTSDTRCGVLRGGHSTHPPGFRSHAALSVSTDELAGCCLLRNCLTAGGGGRGSWTLSPAPVQQERVTMWTQVGTEAETARRVVLLSGRCQSVGGRVRTWRSLCVVCAAAERGAVRCGAVRCGVGCVCRAGWLAGCAQCVWGPIVHVGARALSLVRARMLATAPTAPTYLPTCLPTYQQQ